MKTNTTPANTNDLDSEFFRILETATKSDIRLLAELIVVEKNRVSQLPVFSESPIVTTGDQK